MIHEEICTYEVAKLAKEKGFNEYVEAFYAEDCDTAHSQGPEKWNEYKGKYAAPTQSLLQRWLREDKGIVIDVVLDWQYNIEVEEIRYQHRIGSNRRMTIGCVQTRGIVCDRYFATYELALEDALKYTLQKLV